MLKGSFFDSDFSNTDEPLSKIGHSGLSIEMSSTTFNTRESAI